MQRLKIVEIRRDGEREMVVYDFEDGDDMEVFYMTMFDGQLVIRVEHLNDNAGETA